MQITRGVAAICSGIVKIDGFVEVEDLGARINSRLETCGFTRQVPIMNKQATSIIIIFFLLLVML